jgi:hypothetical protein
MMIPANYVTILKGWSVYAAAVIVRFKALAPYALIELVLPGGSMMALLLWLYRRRKNREVGSSNSGQLHLLNFPRSKRFAYAWDLIKIPRAFSKPNFFNVA